MRIPDANLLIYAYIDTSPEHLASRQWLQTLLSSPAPVGLPMQTIAAFLRIVTHSRLLDARFTIEQAVSIVDDWLAQPQVSLLPQTDAHWHFVKHALLAGKASGDLVSDALIAAAAYEAGASVETNDRDFKRFPGLRSHNPLETVR